MPMRHRDPDTPIVEFDPRLEVSPFILFRRLKEGRAPALVDVRDEPGELTLAGAERLAGEDWQPSDDADVVLFDQDGTRAVELADRLQERGCAGVKALFGGLELYEFALDPQVVGAETYLRRT